MITDNFFKSQISSTKSQVIVKNTNIEYRNSKPFRISDLGFRIFIWNLLFGITFICVGCASLRGYITEERGFLSLRVKKMWGQGVDAKEYYVTEEQDIINIGDTKNRINNLLGPPSCIEYSLEGYEVWFYKDRKLVIYFDKDYARAFKNL